MSTTNQATYSKPLLPCVAERGTKPGDPRLAVGDVKSTSPQLSGGNPTGVPGGIGKRSWCRRGVGQNIHTRPTQDDRTERKHSKLAGLPRRIGKSRVAKRRYRVKQSQDVDAVHTRAEWDAYYESIGYDIVNKCLLPGFSALGVYTGETLEQAIDRKVGRAPMLVDFIDHETKKVRVVEVDTAPPVVPDSRPAPLVDPYFLADIKLQATEEDIKIYDSRDEKLQVSVLDTRVPSGETHILIEPTAPVLENKYGSPSTSVSGLVSDEPVVPDMKGEPVVVDEPLLDSKHEPAVPIEFVDFPVDVAVDQEEKVELDLVVAGPGDTPSANFPSKDAMYSQLGLEVDFSRWMICYTLVDRGFIVDRVFSYEVVKIEVDKDIRLEDLRPDKFAKTDLLHKSTDVVIVTARSVWRTSCLGIEVIDSDSVGELRVSVEMLVNATANSKLLLPDGEIRSNLEILVNAYGTGNVDRFDPRIRSDTGTFAYHVEQWKKFEQASEHFPRPQIGKTWLSMDTDTTKLVSHKSKLTLLALVLIIYALPLLFIGGLWRSVWGNMFWGPVIHVVIPIMLAILSTLFLSVLLRSRLNCMPTRRQHSRILFVSGFNLIWFRYMRTRICALTHGLKTLITQIRAKDS